ncbi:CobW family GTP-binding protein [Bartonella apis]|uniref:CobW family GTP-binding protein n=1 Tax=Bartonella apis TaxID=1686310 RepID=UPI00096763AC|nr:GTP-binding protein [Bartonella apis]OLY48717.1 GTPase, G3E family [Bartonella apis]
MTDFKNRIAVTIFTGFLGSGKTTLLNWVLKDPLLADTAVIVNEFGEVGIDNLLVEQADDGVIELSNGCLCCTMRGQLVDSLASLVDRLQTGRIKRLNHVVIETTGLADPAPILQALLGHPAMVQSFVIDGVITTVDAINGLETLARHKEARNQVAFADRIVLTKTDLVADKKTLEPLMSELGKLNSTAEILYSDAAHCPPSALVNIGVFDLNKKAPDIKNWLGQEEHEHHHHHHDVNRHSDTIHAFSLTHDRPVPYFALEAFIDLLRANHGAQMLRMKGIVELEEDPSRPVVIHGVQTLFHPPVRLSGWPNDRHETRLVMITDGIDETTVREMFDAFLGKPVLDKADRAAMIDNPLAIPGLKF